MTIKGAVAGIWAVGLIGAIGMYMLWKDYIPTPAAEPTAISAAVTAEVPAEVLDLPHQLPQGSSLDDLVNYVFLPSVFALEQTDLNGNSSLQSPIQGYSTDLKDPISEATAEAEAVLPTQVLPTPTPDPRIAIERIAALEGATPIAEGIYVRQGRDQGYGVDFSELIVDTSSDAKVFLSKPEGKNTLSSILSSYSADACVNGGPFEMEDGSLEGYTVFEGRVYTPSSVRISDATVCITGDNFVSFWPNLEEDPAYCVSGFHRLVSGGAPNEIYSEGNPDYKDKYSLENPRTVLAYDSRHGLLYLVVVDGRSYSSDGLSIGDLVGFVRTHYPDADDAVNLDGGGSSEMVMSNSGSSVIANNPSDGAERPISHAICAKE